MLIKCPSSIGSRSKSGKLSQNYYAGIIDSAFSIVVASVSLDGFDHLQDRHEPNRHGPRPSLLEQTST